MKALSIIAVVGSKRVTRTAWRALLQLSHEVPIEPLPHLSFPSTTLSRTTFIVSQRVHYIELSNTIDFLMQPGILDCCNGRSNWPLRPLPKSFCWQLL